MVIIRKRFITRLRTQLGCSVRETRLSNDSNNFWFALESTKSSRSDTLSLHCGCRVTAGRLQSHHVQQFTAADKTKFYLHRATLVILSSRPKHRTHKNRLARLPVLWLREEEDWTGRARSRCCGCWSRRGRLEPKTFRWKRVLRAYQRQNKCQSKVDKNI